MNRWPFPELPRIFGAREALAREERHYQARHVRPKRPAAQPIEPDRSLWARAVAAGGAR